MNWKLLSALPALCFLLVGAVGDFATYPLMIGSPMGADIKYGDAYKYVMGEQLRRLTGMLGRRTPRFACES